MKIFTIIALVFCVTPIFVGAIEHTKLLRGFLEGLDTQEDLDTLVACSDASILTEWEAMINELRKVTDWSDQVTLLMSLTKAIKPAYLSIKMVLACSNTNLWDIVDKLKKFTANSEQVVKSIIDNIDLIQASLSELAPLWTADNSSECGKVLGALVERIFTS